jgi:hypothetical protein
MNSYLCENLRERGEEVKDHQTRRRFEACDP